MPNTQETVNIPAFLTKLWLLVEDEETNLYIKWSDAGNSFVVFDPTRFAKEILPQYFKHNNMTSFVRQLNMYGFRKKFHPGQGGLIKTEDSSHIEFEHPKFLRNDHKLLGSIKRKITSKEDIRVKVEGVDQILTDVKQMKNKQENISGKLDNMQQDNDALWREVQYLRKRHEQQQKIVSRLIQFLMTLVQNKNPLKRTLLPMISDGGAASSTKYSKPNDTYTESYHMPTVSSSGQPLQSNGATLSEVEDIPTATILGETSQARLTPEMTTNSIQEPLDLVLRDENNIPIITSPQGSDILSTTSDDLDTGQLVMPGPAMSVDSGLQMMPVYSQSSETVRPSFSRSLSIEEQKQHIGDEVNGIQGNLEAIKGLLEQQAPKLNIENIWEIFQPDYGLHNQEFLSSLQHSSVPLAGPSYPVGTELVQYQPSGSDLFPSALFSEEDENSLLTSLDEDARNLITSDAPANRDSNSPPT